MIPILYTTYNRIELTRKTLPILLKNTKHPCQILIVDNGSNKATIEFLKNIQDKRIADKIFLGKNRGIAFAMSLFFNRFYMCEWLAKVDNDTLVPEGWLEKLIKVIEATNFDVVQADHPNGTFALRGNIEFYNNRQSFYDTLPKIYSDQFGSLYKSDVVGGSGIVIKEQFIRQNAMPIRDLWHGWTEYQIQNNGNVGFYTGVQIKLLDMKARISRGELPWKKRWLPYMRRIKRLAQ